MCERCVRNTEIKRAAIDALNAGPAGIDVAQIPGYEAVLALSRRLESIVRLPPTDGQPDPEGVALFKATVRELTWEERTAALGVATWLGEHLQSLQRNLAAAKEQLKDPDVTRIELRFHDGVIQVVKNDVVVEEITLGADTPPADAMDAAERAMAAHRQQQQHHTGS